MPEEPRTETKLETATRLWHFWRKRAEALMGERDDLRAKLERAEAAARQIEDKLKEIDQRSGHQLHSHSSADLWWCVGACHRIQLLALGSEPAMQPTSDCNFHTATGYETRDSEDANG